MLERDKAIAFIDALVARHYGCTVEVDCFPHEDEPDEPPAWTVVPTKRGQGNSTLDLLEIAEIAKGLDLRIWFTGRRISVSEDVGAKLEKRREEGAP